MHALITGVLIASTLVAAAPGTLRIPRHLRPLSQELIDAVNGLGTTWTAGRNHGLEKYSMYAIKRMLGGRKLQRPTKTTRPMMLSTPRDLPTNFDARNEWYECKSINLVRDQGSCGSCWAVAAASAISDRYCIKTGIVAQILSDEGQLVNCSSN